MTKRWLYQFGVLTMIVGITTLGTGCQTTTGGDDGGGGDRCQNSSECDDGLFCNGAEICNGGTCTDGTPPCVADEVCAEETDTCAMVCTADSDCDDMNICTTEVCLSAGGDSGICVFTNTECPEGQSCDSETGDCIDDPEAECTTDEDCEDGDLCTTNVCSDEGACEDPVAVECPEGQECDAATGDCVDSEEEGGDAAAGETTYASDCMGCHGDPGDPPGPVGPGIAGTSAEEIAAELTDPEHVGGVFPDLGEEDYANLAAYLASF